MKYVVSANEMKAIDEYSINDVKIPALILMERAALEVVAFMKKHIKNTDRILVVCGPGNNGGDGIAAGRILYLQGYHVAILFIGDKSKITDQTKQQLEISKNIGLPTENYNKLHEYNVIIDSLFGVGLSKPITGEYEEIIDLVNSCNNTVFSVDIPSGISADTGKVMNVAVKSDYTITFGLQKIGLLLYPGAEYAGKIKVADIGFPNSSIQKILPKSFYYTKEDLCLLPKRNRYSNKGTYGKVLIIAGSKGMSGAAYLAAKASYKTGAGLVKVLTSSENRIIMQSSLPEALFSAYDQEDILSSIQWASTIVIGPGLGNTIQAQQLLTMVRKNAKVPVIIDADGINILADELYEVSKINRSERIEYLNKILPPNTILTPHLAEFSRLTGLPVSNIADNLIDTAKQCSYNNKLIYALKDARTIVASEDRTYINLSGNHGMATGGSGDVLTGIIAALIAQGVEAYKATCLAVFLHGCAGDSARKKKGSYSLMASDIIDALEDILMEGESLINFGGKL